MWCEWHRCYLLDRFRHPFSIAFAFVATHNHFVLDRGGKVFNRRPRSSSCPLSATEDDHLALLGLLNCSTACFWMKQVCHTRAVRSIGRGHQRLSHGSTSTSSMAPSLANFPLPTQAPLDLAADLDHLAQQHRQRHLASRSCRASALPPPNALARSTSCSTTAFAARMIALQEELDWQCYRLYGLPDGRPGATRRRHRRLHLGERAFEIVMARQMAAGELETAWFSATARRRSPRFPSHWPDDYRELVERRLDADRVRPEHRPDRAARVQAALEHRAVGRAATAGPARLAARPPGDRPLLARPCPDARADVLHPPGRTGAHATPTSSRWPPSTAAARLRPAGAGQELVAARRCRSCPCCATSPRA